MMFRMILNLSGNCPRTDLTLRATGLYFFLAAAKVSINSGIGSSVSVVSSLLVVVLVVYDESGYEMSNNERE